MVTATFPLQIPSARVEYKTISEGAMVDLALTRLQQTPLACFLDSAGPIHANSENMILSGRPLGLFLQHRDKWSFYDGRATAKLQWDRHSFAEWLDHFHRSYLGPGGPMLFPMLSYEAFNPSGQKVKPHPIWPEVESVWLLTANSYRFDRRTQTLTCPFESPDGSQTQWPLPQRWPGAETAKGWRETQACYHQKIQAVKKDIFEGNYYQANLSQRFLGETHQSPLNTYKRLRARNPSPFMGVFRWGPVWVLSGSPERLLDKRGTALSTRPIAGTQPRFENPEANQTAIDHLLTSEKERAEHLMLVDLARNDLGRIAKPGSVKVPEFAVVESYSHVHHLVSQVEAELMENVSLVTAIDALFPGGTITGAPKIACMAKLAFLEGEARGPYTGAFGYLDTQENMDLNILIRTLIQRENLICFHAGGGIVADSVDQAEYFETRHKAAALMEALCLDI